MTAALGLRESSDADIERGLDVLGQQMRGTNVFSPLWRASTYWISRSYAELERRHREEWGNCWSFGDPGDEVEN